MTTAASSSPPQAPVAPLHPQPPRRRRRRRGIIITAVVAVIVVAVFGGLLWFVGIPFAGQRYGDDASLFDDFDGAAGAKPDRNAWAIQTGGGGWGNDELQTYTEDAVTLDGQGNLVITATVPPDGAGGTPTSGRITTAGKWSFTFGRLSARIKLPEGQGLLPAFWLLGDSLERVGWPAAGEIDIVETPRGTSRSAHHLHGPRGEPGKNNDAWSLGGGVDAPAPLSEDFHVYTVEKQPGRVIIAVDDRVVLDVSEWDVPVPGTWVFDAPTHALFSLAVGGNWPGPPDATTPVVNEMLIDWILYTPADQIGDAPLGTLPDDEGTSR
ncbi:glycoside hydrolase family 16 protein [Microbacterium sp.]|uniref:glycoside hydrolase family 16 protein n=1 Tax=Microbacterium sp. TaxID=51671 RepID=UPI003C76C5AB